MTKLVVVQPQDVVDYGANAALLLGQLEYWLYKAKGGQSRFIVRRDGHAWVAKTRAELCAETGLTQQQIRLAIERLKAAKVLIVERHLFNNLTVSFTRTERGQSTHTGVVKNTQTGMGVSTQLQYTETEEETVKDLATASQSVSGKTEKGSQGKKKEGVSEGMPPRSRIGLSVAENAAGLKQAALSAPVSVGNVSKPSQLQWIFKKAWDTTYEHYGPFFSGKDIGNLKTIIERCPEGGSGPVVDWCVRHWPEFVSTAVAHQGAFNAPTYPTVSFILQYLQSALNASTEALRGGGEGSASVVSKPAKVWNVPQPDPIIKIVAPKPTLAEVAKALGMDE